MKTGTPLEGRGIKTGGIEVYPAGRFFTVTGTHLAGTPATVNDATDWLTAFWEANHKGDTDVEVSAETRRKLRDAKPVTPEQFLADTKLLNQISSRRGQKFINCYYREDGWMPYYGDDQSRADMYVTGDLGFYTEYDEVRMDRLFRRSKLIRPKWDEAGHTAQGDTYGEMTIQKVVNEAMNKILFGESR